MTISLSFGRLLAAASTLAFVATGASVPAAAQTAQGMAADAKPAPQQDMVDPSLPTQLPRTAVPHRYTIDIVPNAQALTFGGSVRIALDIVKPTDTLVLNAADLAMDSVTLYGPDGKSHAAKVTLNADAQTASFDFGERMPKGAYLLDIVYTEKSARRRTDCSRWTIRTRTEPSAAGCSPSSKRPMRAALYRAGTSRITRPCSICPPPFRRTRWRSATCR